MVTADATLFVKLYLAHLTSFLFELTMAAAATREALWMWQCCQQTGWQSTEVYGS